MRDLARISSWRGLRRDLYRVVMVRHDDDDDANPLTHHMHTYAFHYICYDPGLCVCVWFWTDGESLCGDGLPSITPGLKYKFIHSFILCAELISPWLSLSLSIALRSLEKDERRKERTHGRRKAKRDNLLIFYIRHTKQHKTIRTPAILLYMMFTTRSQKKTSVEGGGGGGRKVLGELLLLLLLVDDYSFIFLSDDRACVTPRTPIQSIPKINPSHLPHPSPLLLCEGTPSKMSFLLEYLFIYLRS